MQKQHGWDCYEHMWNYVRSSHKSMFIASESKRTTMIGRTVTQLCFHKDWLLSSPPQYAHFILVPLLPGLLTMTVFTIFLSLRSVVWNVLVASHENRTEVRGAIGEIANDATNGLFSPQRKAVLSGKRMLAGLSQEKAIAFPSFSAFSQYLSYLH